MDKSGKLTQHTDMSDSSLSEDSARTHGGNLTWASEAYGIPLEDWLDLSTGINPKSYPMSAIDPKVWQRLPLDSDQEALLDAAREAYSVPEHICLCAAPGTQAIIQWLPRLLGSASVSITVVSPTYGEHAHTWSQAGFKVAESPALPPNPADITIITNPNNPDGRIVEPSVLLDYARRLPDQGVLIVDEAFADVAPKASIIPHLREEPVIVLRSFGKFFGLAGLRLGFAIGQAKHISLLSTALGPWAIPQPAITVGAQALSDRHWIGEMRQALHQSAQRLDALLHTAGLSTIGGTHLFRLVESRHTSSIHDQLAKQGIWTRPFSYNGNWLRLGLPGSESDWAILEKALMELNVHVTGTELTNAAE